MPKEMKVGCGVKKELKKPVETKISEQQVFEVKEESQMVKVGQPAPVFSAPAFYNGNFVNVDLEEYKGKWVLLCFYPGDFTFV